MSEILKNLPKNAPERIKTAHQVRLMRNLDSSNVYVTSRSLYLYIHYFAGLEAYFEYVKSLEKSNTVLDIGAGKAIAINQLAYGHCGEGLTFAATVLTALPKDGGKVKVLATSAEVLRGIGVNSIAGILACHSLAYSAVPEYAIRRLDQVLIEGGIIKATFSRLFSQEVNPPTDVDMKTSERFVGELKRLQYDIVTYPHMIHEVLIAKKPGGKSAVTARSILENDVQIYWGNFRNPHK